MWVNKCIYRRKLPMYIGMPGPTLKHSPTCGGQVRPTTTTATTETGQTLMVQVDFFVCGRQGPPSVSHAKAWLAPAWRGQTWTRAAQTDPSHRRATSWAPLAMALQ